MKYIAVPDVIEMLKAAGVQMTENQLMSQPTTRRMVDVQGEPAISITQDTDLSGNTTLIIR